MMDEQLKHVLGNAMAKSQDGILEYVTPQRGAYDDMPQYEQEEMVARANLILDALAAHYDMDTTSLLRLLEQHRGYDAAKH